MRTLAYIFTMMFLTLVVPPVWSADEPAPTTIEEAHDQIVQLERKLKDLEMINGSLNSRLNQTQSVFVIPEYRHAWIKYKTQLMDRNVRTFDWQNEATQSIHNTTIVLVVAALIISVVQMVFGMAFRPKQQTTTKKEAETLELSATRIKIATTVSGMILLLITFAFFYVYINEVYTIKAAA